MGIDPFSLIVIALGAVFLGSTVALVNGWLKAVRAVNQPQRVVHTTDKTPGEMVAAARAARAGLRIFAGLGVAALLAAYSYYDRAGAQNFLLALRDLVLQLIDILITLLRALRSFLANLG
jgi:hypothetical protein